MDLETSRNEVANRNPEGPTRTWCYQACWEAYAGILGAQVLFMIYFFGIEDFVSSCLSLVQIVTALLVLWKRQFSFLGITCVVASVLFGVLVAIAAGALGEVSVPYIVAVGELGMVATEKSRKLAMLVGASVVAGVMVLHNLVMMTLGQFRERDQILKGQTMRRIEKTADDVQELAGRGAGAMMMQAASFRRSVTALSAASYQAMGLNRRLSSGAAFEGGSSDVGLDLETAGRGREKDRHRPSLGTVLEGAEGEETEAVPAPPSSFLSYRQQTAGSRLGLGEVGEGGGGIGEGEGEPPQPSLQKTEQRQRWSSSLLPPPRVSLDREGDRERTAKDEEDKKALHDKANEEEKGKDTAAEEAKKQAESHPRPPFGDKQTSGPSDLPKITREQVQAGTSALHSLLGPTALESPRHSSQQEEESEEEEESDEEESEESEEEEEAEEPSRPQSNREKKEGEKEEKEKPGERADTAAVPKEKEKENLSRLNSARRDRDAPAQEPKSAEEKEKEGKDRGIKQEVPPPPHRQSSQAHRDGDRRGGAAATNEAHARRDSFWTPLAEQPPFASTDALGGPRGPPGGEALPRGSAEVEVEEGPPHAPEQRRESGEVPGPSGLLIGAGGICEGGGNGRLGPNYGTISQASRSPPIPPLTGASFPGHNGGTATERSPPTPGGTSRAESPLSRAAPFQSLGGGSVAAGLSSPSRGPNRSVTSSALRRRRDEQRRDSSAPLEPPATRTGEEHDPPPRAFSPATREAMRHSPAPRARAPVPHESLARETFLSVALQGQAERERQPRDPSRGRPQTLQQQKEILMSHILKGEKGGIVPRLFSSESAAPPANDATDASATGRGADHDREAGVGEGGQGLREREGASQGQSLAAVTPPRASAPLQLGEMASITGGFTPPSLRLAGDGNDAAPRRDRRRSANTGASRSHMPPAAISAALADNFTPGGRVLERCIKRVPPERSVFAEELEPEEGGINLAHTGGEGERERVVDYEEGEVRVEEEGERERPNEGGEGTGARGRATESANERTEKREQTPPAEPPPPFAPPPMLSGASIVPPPQPAQPPAEQGDVPSPPGRSPIRQSATKESLSILAARFSPDTNALSQRPPEPSLPPHMRARLAAAAALPATAAPDCQNTSQQVGISRETQLFPGREGEDREEASQNMMERPVTQSDPRVGRALLLSLDSMQKPRDAPSQAALSQPQAVQPAEKRPVSPFPQRKLAADARTRASQQQASPEPPKGQQQSATEAQNVSAVCGPPLASSSASLPVPAGAAEAEAPAPPAAAAAHESPREGGHEEQRGEEEREKGDDDRQAGEGDGRLVRRRVEATRSLSQSQEDSNTRLSQQAQSLLPKSNHPSHPHSRQASNRQQPSAPLSREASLPLPQAHVSSFPGSHQPSLHSRNPSFLPSHPQMRQESSNLPDETSAEPPLPPDLPAQPSSSVPSHNKRSHVVPPLDLTGVVAEQQRQMAGASADPLLMQTAVRHPTPPKEEEPEREEQRENFPPTGITPAPPQQTNAPLYAYQQQPHHPQAGQAQPPRALSPPRGIQGVFSQPMQQTQTPFPPFIFAGTANRPPSPLARPSGAPSSPPGFAPPGFSAQPRPPLFQQPGAGQQRAPSPLRSPPAYPPYLPPHAHAQHHPMQMGGVPPGGGQTQQQGDGEEGEEEEGGLIQNLLDTCFRGEDSGV